FCRTIFDGRTASTEIAPLYQLIALHVTQATYERAAADGMQRCYQLGRALRPGHKIAHHQHSPLVANHLERAPDRAAIAFASSQNLIVPPFAATAYHKQAVCDARHICFKIQRQNFSASSNPATSRSG